MMTLIFASNFVALGLQGKTISYAVMELHCQK
jgi:hypothetical protein